MEITITVTEEEFKNLPIDKLAELCGKRALFVIAEKYNSKDGEGVGICE